MTLRTLLIATIIASCSVQDPGTDIGIPGAQDSSDPIPEPRTIIIPQATGVDTVSVVDQFSGRFGAREVRNAETSGLFAFNLLWYHAEDTQLFLGARVECPEVPVVTMRDFALLELPDTVSVPEWMGMRQQDFLNWAHRLDPIHHQLTSGEVRFEDARYERAYRGESREEVLIFKYSLAFEDIRFSNGFQVQSLRSEQYTCYPGTQFWFGDLHN
ncbi:MAG: hypothetical protein JJ896_01180 [Rhodothermales bacterium]|nr:hypothetical protein [Rhodothermales bacterium]MBO6778241.1 hypothetical protein [Rhodothermales bacterium]